MNKFSACIRKREAKTLKFISVLTLLGLAFSTPLISQTKNVGIGTNSPNASALLDLDVSDGSLFTTKLGLLIPRMTTAQRDAIASPALSLLIFNTTTSKYEYYTGSGWAQLLPSGEVSFSLLQSGTNTSAAMLVGGGASLASTGGGTISANIFTGSGSSTNAVDLASGEVSGALTFGNGGTGLTATPANGQLLIGNGAGYALANLTAGSNITVTNSAGGIQISASGLESILNFQAPLSRTGPNVSIPAATGATNGYLTSTDWTTFNSKENSITAGTNAQYWRGDKTWQNLNTTVVPEGTNQYYTDARARAALSAVGPLSYNSGTGAISIAANTAANAGVVAAGSGNVSKVWKTDASGVPAWRDDAAGTGTVTSVGITMPAQFSVSGSPITDAGSFAINWNNAAANAIFAGPASGAAGAPAFRALTDDDIPNDISINGYLPLAGGSMTGGIDMTNHLLLNIGVAGTDFTATGGLNLADALNVSSGGASINGDLSVTGNISATGSASFPGKATSGLTISTDPGATLVTKSYVDTLSGSTDYEPIITFNASSALKNNRILAAGDGISLATGSADGDNISIALTNSGATAGTYGSANQVAQIAVDSYGRITSASNVAISGVTPGGAAGGDLGGTYPNPSVTKLQSRDVSTALPADGNYLRWNGTTSQWEPAGITVTGAWSTSGNTIGLSDFLGSGTGTNPLIIKINGSESMRLVDGGSIGIGDDSPDARLEILKPASGGILMVSSNEAGNGDLFAIASSGKAGFGTNDPQTQVDVNGAIALRNQTLSLVGSELQVGNSSFIKIDQTGTFTLSDGIQAGHYLVLESAVDDVKFLDGGNLALSGDWDSDTLDAITLMWDGSKWIELSRSINH